MKHRSWLAVPAAALLSLAFASDGRAQAPAGGEFRVNTYTTSAQRWPSITARASGDFVIAWQSNGPDGGDYGIRAQRYDRAGVALGTEFAVNTYTTDVQLRPSASSNAKGAFVITWHSYGQDGSYFSSHGQRFTNGGVPVGAEFAVNTYTTGYQYLPVPAVAANGSFVVAWSSFAPGQDGSFGGIQARRWDASGNPLGGEFQVNTYTTGYQVYSSVATAPNGNFVVVWQSDLQDGDGYAVVGQRFDSSGTKVGGEFIVNSTTTGDQLQPAVSVHPAGGFVVSWQSPDGDTYGLRARVFAPSGNPLGPDFAVNTYTTDAQYGYSVSTDSQGNFVVVWASYGGDGEGQAVFGQRFTALGARRGAEFRVNTVTTSDQSMPDVTSDEVGNFEVSWRSLIQDGSFSGVYAQRFGGLSPFALGVDTNGNDVWEPGETADMRPTWRNTSGVAQTFTGTLSGLTGPSGPTYTITDATALYGPVANNANGECTDCFGIQVSSPATRPSTHWDATALEALTPDVQGQQKTWTLHVGNSFTDVSTTSNFYRFIETLLHYSITGGCTTTAYCPASSTTREQMSVFVLVAKEGAGFAPPACSPPNVFNDVPETSPFCRFIEELAARGVVSGCGGGAYCPTQPVTREQMAVFVLRTLDPALNPPACGTPVFNDVPASSGFCKWIEELVRRGVVTGCAPNLYCPTDPVTREQMGVFISVTFGLTLYGP